MINENVYLHPMHKEKENELKKIMKFEKEVLTYYKEFDEKLRKPDLLGKTVVVGEHQFHEAFETVNRISNVLDIPVPQVYVYEDFYYGVESKGTDTPWVEVSAKTLIDMSSREIEFLFARELCRIKQKSVYIDTLANQVRKIVEENNIIPGSDMLAKTLKMKHCKWARISHYSADRFGYFIVRDLAVCCSSILKLVLNNLELVKQVDLFSYIEQTSLINEIDDTVSRFTKNDEHVPYGPFRIKSLIAYASSLK